MLDDARRASGSCGRSAAPDGDGRATRSSTTCSPTRCSPGTADSRRERELERERATSDRQHRRLLLVSPPARSRWSRWRESRSSRSRNATRRAGRPRSRGRASGRLGPACSLGRPSPGSRPTRSRACRALSTRFAWTVGPGTDALRQALVLARERAILPSRGPVNSVACSPDGSLVLTASDDGLVRVWSRHTGRLSVLSRRAPRSHRDLQPGWEARSRARAARGAPWRLGGSTTPTVLAHGAKLTSTAFIGDGARVLTTGADGRARLWTTSGRQLSTIHNAGPVRGGWLSPDGRLL